MDGSCFNPSCGLIGCGTWHHGPGGAPPPRQFQSLVRVDWLWNSQTAHSAWPHHSFNPSCGLIGCGTSAPLWTLCFNPSCGLIGCGTRTRSFNPSCGLIGCGTARVTPRATQPKGEFQSLVRVDWLWKRQQVSMAAGLRRQLQSFNPSCGLIGCGTMLALEYIGSFNPSCGLIGCGTYCTTACILRFERPVSIPRAG